MVTKRESLRISESGYVTGIVRMCHTNTGSGLQRDPDTGSIRATISGGEGGEKEGGRGGEAPALE